MSHKLVPEVGHFWRPGLFSVKKFKISLYIFSSANFFLEWFCRFTITKLNLSKSKLHVLCRNQINWGDLAKNIWGRSFQFSALFQGQGFPLRFSSFLSPRLKLSLVLESFLIEDVVRKVNKKTYKTTPPLPIFALCVQRKYHYCLIWKTIGPSYFTLFITFY